MIVIVVFLKLCKLINYTEKQVKWEDQNKKTLLLLRNLLLEHQEKKKVENFKLLIKD